MNKGKPRTGNGGRKEPAYPCYGLQGAMHIGELVWSEGGGRGEVSKKVIAAKMNVADDASSLSQLISAAKAFKIVRGWREYALTEEGQRYFMPTDENEQKQAQFAFLVGPPAFKMLVDRFDGSRLPSTENLRNLLMRDARIPKSWAVRVAQIFVNSAREIGVIDDQGFLRYGAAMHGQRKEKVIAVGAATETNKATPITPVKHARPPGEPAAVHHRATEDFQVRDMAAIPALNTWVYGDASGTVRLETPIDMSRELWERLNRFVQVLAPPGAAPATATSPTSTKEET